MHTRNTSSNTFVFLVALFATVTMTGSAFADTISLAWDPNPETEIAGYIVHVGTQPATYDRHVDVGLATTWVFGDALTGQQYCFAVSAYFAGPVEGPLSNEVCGYSTSPPLLLNPGSQTSTVGEPATLQLEGSDPGGEPVSYGATGLPPGLSLGTSTGFISGTPTTVGTSTVTATVSNGLLTSSQTFSWSVVAPDTIAPVVAITGPTSSATYATTAATLTLSGTASDNVGVTQVNWVSSRGGSGIATGTTAWSAGSISLLSGTNVLTVTVRDAAGNTSSDALTVTLNVAPTLTSVANQTTTVGLATTLQLVGSDANGDPLTYSATGLPPGLSVGASSGLISGTPTVVGSYNVTASVSDGWLSASRTFTWTVVAAADTTAPAVTITSPTTAATFTTGASTLTLSGSASDNVGVTRVSWVNSRGGSGTASGTTGWSASGVPLQGGSNILTVTARDAAGNTATDVLTVTYNPPDTQAPAVTIASPTSASSYTTSTATVGLSGTASDNVGVTRVSWVNDRGGSGVATGTTSWSALVALQSGRNVLTVTARDAAGNSATDTLVVTYVIPLAVALSADRPAPQVAGTSIGFTAAASGGVTPYQYRWWVFDGSTWVTVQNWSSINTYTWRPLTPNSAYRIQVQVRDASSAWTSTTMSFPIN